MLVLAIGSFLAAWAFWIEPASLRTSSFELTLPKLPATCSGLRIAVLADIHAGSPFKGLGTLDKLVAATQATNPDLVLLAGDYVIDGVLGGRWVSPEDAANKLGALQARMGVYAVLGNHDWWLDAERVAKALTDNGIRMLEDASQSISLGDCSFHLAGVSDYWEGPHDLQAALAQIQDEASVILFTHNPDIFPEVPMRVALTIAGHTHGGQVYIPLVGRPIVPSAYGERYAIGHIIEQGKHLFVSSGIGTSILPVRFLVPPEVTVLTLHGATSQE